MDIDKIMDAQKSFFLSGKTLDVKYRKNALSDLRQGILDMEDEINSALKEDLGKSGFESYMCETGMTLSELSHMIKHIGRYARKRRVRTPIAQFPAKSYIIPEPFGNVLIMSPWNYPFLLCISPLVSALAAGNTAILKPSAYSPATSAVIKKLTGKVFDNEYVSVIEGGRDVNSHLLDKKFDYIFFTGSKEVGRIVMSKASAHLTPVTLELGGKSPVIIDASANPEIAAKRIVFGKYLNCGQTCVAPDYVLVHRDIADESIRLCIEKTNEMFGPDALKNKDYGKIINGKHFSRLVSLISEADGFTNEAGMQGKLISGGRSDSGTLKIEPSIVTLGCLSSLKDSAPETVPEIMREEIFGPVLPIITFDSLDETVDYINSRPKPLATYIFTEKDSVRRRLLRDLHFGGGCINDTVIHLATEQMPFGGVGESGIGAYHGKFGFDTFSHLKSIVDKPTWLDLPMRYHPYTSLNETLVRFFMK